MPASDRLADKIAEIKSTLAEAKAKAITLNEAQTEALIIDPLLTTLGFGPLEFQKRGYDAVASNFPDYTLLPGTAHKWFLEVKKLDLPLRDGEASQAVNYANNQGAAWAVLTNGRVWYFYNAHAPVPLTEKRVFQIDDLFNDSQADEVLLSLSRASMATNGLTERWLAHRIKEVVEREIATPNSSTRKALRKLSAAETQNAVTDEAVGKALNALFAKTLASVSDPILPAVPPNGTDIVSDTPPDYGSLRPLLEYGKSPELITSRKPKHLLLGNGPAIPIKSWSVLAQNVVRFIGETYQLPPLPFVGSTSGKKYFLNTIPTRADGKQMITMVSVNVSGQTVYLDMNRSSHNTITGLIGFMEAVGAPGDSVRLEVGDVAKPSTTAV